VDDLITWASNRSEIGTLAQRKARYVLLVRLPDSHTAEATSAGVAEAMSWPPAGLRRTLTWDQGNEMAGPRPARRRPRDEQLLLRGSLVVAEADEQEHEWPAPRLLPNGKGPCHPLPGTAQGRRGRAGQPAKQVPEAGDPRTVFACPLPYRSSLKVSTFA